MLAAGASSRDIANSFHCHSATVYRTRQKVEEFGEARPTSMSLIDHLCDAWGLLD
jgi:transposase